MASDAHDNWRATPLAALELSEIPSEAHFVRDHFPPPEFDRDSWSLLLSGSNGSRALTLDTLRHEPSRTLRVVLECAGHRRIEFDPVPPGVPWGTGAVAEALWTGASLGPQLERAGVPSSAREVVLAGADAGSVEGFPGVHRFARSLPVAKALDPDVLLAYEMNAQPIPVERGGPVRVIVPGWYATDAVKWLDRIWFSDEAFDGVFQAHDYRLRAADEPGAGSRMTELPVNALITSPVEGGTLVPGDTTIRGIAWGGSGGISEVLVCVDQGAWTPAVLAPGRGPYARVNWEVQTMLAEGPHAIACRAIDVAGHAQPDFPLQNVRGYGNNAVHRIAVRATDSAEHLRLPLD